VTVAYSADAPQPVWVAHHGKAQPTDRPSAAAASTAVRVYGTGLSETGRYSCARGVLATGLAPVAYAAARGADAGPERRARPRQGARAGSPVSPGARAPGSRPRGGPTARRRPARVR